MATKSSEAATIARGILIAVVGIAVGLVILWSVVRVLSA